MRGQLDFFLGGLVRSRIIPARAGPTKITSLDDTQKSDHPRSCGANCRLSNCSPWAGGSSPLVRGQLNDPDGAGYQKRIIPARAGPTDERIPDPYASADHPRSCGANLPVTDAVAGLAGSSPLVRGQLGSSRLPPRSCRIIPARAGPTQRVREPARGLQGSSPLVRGQPIHSIQKVVGRNPRINPARAGPTTAR